jgi:hypothetical protein
MNGSVQGDIRVIVHFGAVLGINEEGTNLLLGDRCSFKFAGFIYCIRVLFLEHVLPTSMRPEMTAQDIDHFLEMRAKFLVVGGYNLTGELIKWLGYGKIMSLQKINQPSITWTRPKRAGRMATSCTSMASRSPSADSKPRSTT